MVVMKYTAGWKYKTEEDIEVTVPEMGLVSAEHTLYILLLSRELRISKSYAWNGASFVLFKWFGTPESWMVPSLIHDALYQLMRESKLTPTYRRTVDGIFYRLLRERGVSWVVAIVAYWAVRLGGNYAMRHGARVREVM